MKDDLISRKAAIGALEDAGIINYQSTGDFHGIINALTVIKNLPTADPSVITMKIDVDKERFRQVMEGCELAFAPSEIVRCHDCLWWRPPEGCSHGDGMVTSTAQGFCSYGERGNDG